LMWRPRKGEEGEKVLAAEAGCCDSIGWLFCLQPHTPKDFRGHFRMNKELLMYIVYIIYGVRVWLLLQVRENPAVLVGFSLGHKCTTTLSCIAYEAPTDTQDDYLCMSESTCQATMSNFFGQPWQCLHQSIWERQMKKTQLKSCHGTKQENFLGWLEALIACNGMEELSIHLPGVYKYHIKECSVVFEAVEDYNLWSCHTFFGITMLRRSPVFARPIKVR
jgi:hypothetical protein